MCNRMLDAFDLPKTTSSVTPFCLENGKEILQSVFPTVEEAVIHNALVFHHATPIVNYISSMFPSLNIPDNTHLHEEMKEWLKEEVKMNCYFITVYGAIQNVSHLSMSKEKASIR